jgi:serine/threonine-protein phosphatase 6 regulatory ankyrin repeat subunit B
MVRQRWCNDNGNKITRDIKRAIRNGRTEIVAKLMKKKVVDVDGYYNIHGQTLIMLAIENGYPDIVSLLVEKGADVNITDDDDLSALRYASMKGDTETVSVLMENGAEYVDTLMWLIKKGDTEIVSMLLKKGANVNAKDKNGCTALIQASRNGHTDIVGMLLEKGVYVNAKDKYGWTALMKASWHGHTETVAMLVDNGADMTVRDCEEDLTPFQFACGDGNEELVKFFLDKGVDVNSNTDDGPTALMLACLSKNINIIKMLIDNGANINWKDSEGVTAINQASFREKPEIVSLLLDNGADANIKDKWGDSAITKAIEYENTEILTLIKNHINRMVSLVIKKGRTKDEIPLVPYAQRETIYHIASFF